MVEFISKNKKNIINNILILSQIFFIFVFPVFLIYFNIVSYFYFRLLFLFLGVLFIYGIIRYEKWSLYDLGIRTDNFKDSFIPYLLFTIFGVLALFLITYFFDLKHETNNIFYIRTFLLFIPISFLQEFAFRSFLIPKLKKVYKHDYIVILLNSLFFAFMHIIYPNINIGIPTTFLGGIFFAYLYIKYPNLILVGISHSILNLTALLFGLFVP